MSELHEATLLLEREGFGMKDDYMRDFFAPLPLPASGFRAPRRDVSQTYSARTTADLDAGLDAILFAPLMNRGAGMRRAESRRATTAWSFAPSDDDARSHQQRSVTAPARSRSRSPLSARVQQRTGGGGGPRGGALEAALSTPERRLLAAVDPLLFALTSAATHSSTTSGSSSVASLVYAADQQHQHQHQHRHSPSSSRASSTTSNSSRRGDRRDRRDHRRDHRAMEPPRHADDDHYRERHSPDDGDRYSPLLPTHFQHLQPHRASAAAAAAAAADAGLLATAQTTTAAARYQGSSEESESESESDRSVSSSRSLDPPHRTRRLASPPTLPLEGGGGENRSTPRQRMLRTRPPRRDARPILISIPRYARAHAKTQLRGASRTLSPARRPPRVESTITRDDPQQQQQQQQQQQ